MLIAGAIAGLTAEEVGKVAVCGALTGITVYAGVRFADYVIDKLTEDDETTIDSREVAELMWNDPQGRQEFIRILDEVYGY